MARSAARRRSIVASDIAINAAAIIGGGHLPAGGSSTAQQNPNATTVSASYSGARVLRGTHELRLINAAASALRAWLQCRPVVAHGSSRDHALDRLLGTRYLVAIVLATAGRWLIVNPILGATGNHQQCSADAREGAHSQTIQREALTPEPRIHNLAIAKYAFATRDVRHA